MTKSRENLKETTSKISIKIKVKEAKTLIISQANKEIKIEITEALIRINNLVIIEVLIKINNLKIGIDKT